MFFYGGSGRALRTNAQNFEARPSLDVTPHQKNSALPISFMPSPIPPLIADHILEKSISNSFYTHFASGGHFQFHNHDLFEKAHWN